MYTPDGFPVAEDPFAAAATAEAARDFETLTDDDIWGLLKAKPKSIPQHLRADNISLAQELLHEYVLQDAVVAIASADTDITTECTSVKASKEIA